MAADAELPGGSPVSLSNQEIREILQEALMRPLSLRRMTIALLTLAVLFPAALATAAEEASVADQVTESIELLTADNTPYRPNGREAAMDFLASHPQEAAMPMLDALEQEKSGSARLWLLLCMNRFEDMSVFDPGAQAVVDQLNAEDFGTRYWAVKTVAEMNLQAAVAPLTEMLSSDDYLVREAAARALGKIGSDQPVEELIKLLDDEKASVKMAAIEALGELAATAAKAPLIKVMKDANLAEQQAAVFALEKITATSFNITPGEWGPTGGPARDKKIKEWLEKNQ
jgi:hypothetical protein